MDNILWINACFRPGSRTLELAQTLLAKLDGNVQELRLQELSLPPLDLTGMQKRNQAATANDFSDPIFDAAKQFAAADVIVIAAPYWDLMFPAALKVYLENITVAGITFFYTDQGRPQSLCKAKALHYLTTSGGFIGENDFGFAYVNALAQNFFGIAQIHRYSAEGLDIFGTNVEKVMHQAKSDMLHSLAIDSEFRDTPPLAQNP